ncbi:MAG: hypothetical protein N2067_04050 [Spirochaetaceae bacterium]|nr:hypothetical protein [Spirochaetaceae bacterium]
MKKFVLVALFAAVVFGSAFAATDGEIKMTGKVSEIFSVTLPSAFEGVMNDNVLNTWDIGKIKVISNAKNWTITIGSANSGNLVNSVYGEKVPYTFTLGELVKNQSLASAWTSAAQARTPKAGTEYALSISFGPSTEFYQVGTYTDTLKVSIAHN